MGARSEHVDRLAEVMDTDPAALDFLRPLTDDEVARLHDLVARSLEAEDQRVRDALQATMRVLPRPLRGRAKKMLFPEGHR